MSQERKKYYAQNSSAAIQYSVTWNAENRDQSRLYKRRYNQKSAEEKTGLVAEKKLIYDMIRSGPCLDCDRLFDPVAMDLDHRPGAGKLFGLSQGVGRKGITREMFWAELEKCDLVCACCHRIRTRDRNLGPV